MSTQPKREIHHALRDFATSRLCVKANNEMHTISGKMYRPRQIGFAHTFDQLDQGGSFQSSVSAAHQDDQSKKWRFANQRQEIIPVAVTKI
jgi:hypothetical protein